jgi:hypothetical protein
VVNRDRTLDLLAHRLDRAANTVPDIYDHLDEQRSYAPVLAAQDTSRPTVGGGISDPTGRTVVQLDEAGCRRRAIDDYVASIALGIDCLERECRQALGWRMAQSPADSASDAHLSDTPLCIDCKTKIPTVRTGRDGATIDDRRCIDCGRAWDDLLDRRRDEAHDRRLRRHAARYGSA